MSKLEFQANCACGKTLKTKVKKPTRFENSFTKINCRACGSRYMLTCKRDLENKRERVFTTFVDLLELGDETKQKLSAEMSVKAKLGVARVKNAFGIEPEPDKSVIETEMD